MTNELQKTSVSDAAPVTQKAETDTVAETDAETSAPTSGALLKLLSIVGLIGLLTLATWFSVQVIRFAPRALDVLSGVSFSSIFTRNAPDDTERITFALETLTYQSGRPFTLAWSKNGNPEAREYVFTYACAEGVSFTVLRGTENTTIACDTPYSFTSVANQIVLLPESTVRRFTDVTVRLTEMGDNSPAQAVLLTITNEALPEIPHITDATNDAALDPREDGARIHTPYNTATVRPVYPTQPSVVYVPNPSVISDPTGRPDLRVRILETGVVATVGGKEKFFSITPIPSNQRAAVRFVVENVGTRTSSEDWVFVARLPIQGNPNFEFRSPKGQALGPQDRIEFTLKFDDIEAQGTAEVRITVEGERDDVTAANNTATTRLSVTAR